MKRVLEERGFNVAKLRAKCSPVCPIENTNCCMARLLSQQDDFKNQPSMLETFIHSRGHECIFLPKFHCELNPIEMVCTIYSKHVIPVLIKVLVLGLVQIPLPAGGEENLSGRQGSSATLPGRMSKGGYTAFHKPIMAVYECLP